MTTRFKTKRDEILHTFDSIVGDYDISKDEAMNKTKATLDDIDNGYIVDVINKNRMDLSPNTRQQKAICQIYDENQETNPDITHREIAEEVNKRFDGISPSKSAVSDALQKFRNIKRSNPEEYTVTEETFKPHGQNNKKQQSTSVEIDNDEDCDEDNQKSSKEDIVKELAPEGECISDDEFFAIIQSLIKNDQDSIAQKLMQLY